MAFDYQTLMNQVTGYAATGNASEVQLLRLGLLQAIANQVSLMPTDYQSLLSSTNVSGYQAAANGSIADLLELALLQVIANNVSGGGGGSGTGFTFANYGGGQPNFTPSGGTGAAVDTSNGTVWLYYNGQWN